MIRFVLRRLVIGLIALTLFSFVMFWMVETLIPGDFFSGSRLFLSAEEVDALREQFGVDRSIHIRWWRWLVGFATNGFGVSTSGFGVLVRSPMRSHAPFSCSLLVSSWHMR